MDVKCHWYWAVDRGVAQPGRALGWGPSGRWFESSLPDHFLLEVFFKFPGDPRKVAAVVIVGLTGG